MDKVRPSLFILGLVLLTMVGIVLFNRVGSPSQTARLTFSRTVQGSVDSEMLVNLSMSVNTQEHLNEFPRVIGNWEAGQNFSSLETQEYLHSDAYILRSYYLKNQLSQPFILLVLHSAYASSFHPPQECYKSQGYRVLSLQSSTLELTKPAFDQIQSPGKDPLDRSLVDLLKNEEQPFMVPINRLLINKINSRGVVIERQLVLFTYLHDIQSTNTELSLVRVSAQIPVNQESAEIEAALQGFLSEVFDAMIVSFYSNNQLALSYIAGLGAPGYILLVLIILIPFALISYPVIFWLKRANQNPQNRVSTGSPGRSVQKPGYSTAPGISTTTDKTALLKTIPECYDYCLSLFEKQLSIKPEANITLRERLKKMRNCLPPEILDDFRELTELTEQAGYSTITENDSRSSRAPVLVKQIEQKLNGQWRM